MSSVAKVMSRGDKMEPVSIEFISEGSCVCGKFFQSFGTIPSTTLLLVPGWPGEPNDVLDLGALLVEQGINVCIFNPRGLHPSEGFHTHANTLKDIESALQWLRQADVQKRFRVDKTRLVLGGHSYGGGIAMVYAARDPSVRQVISIAGADFGEIARETQRNEAFAEEFRRANMSTRRPEGPAQFDFDAGLKEWVDHQDVYGLRENAANLADRSILLLGGWEDEQVTIDQYLLPLYRALKGAGAAKVTFLVYHTDHDFSNARPRLAVDIADWLQRD
jgi:pimeloyl-ACP methyl ester carboxylesterase